MSDKEVSELTEYKFGFINISHLFSSAQERVWVDPTRPFDWKVDEPDFFSWNVERDGPFPVEVVLETGRQSVGYP